MKKRQNAKKIKNNVKKTEKSPKIEIFSEKTLTFKYLCVKILIQFYLKSFKEY